MRVGRSYRSARGREGSPNGGDRTLAFRLPGTTDPRQRRGWEQTSAAPGVSLSHRRVAPGCSRFLGFCEKIKSSRRTRGVRASFS